MGNNSGKQLRRSRSKLKFSTPQLERKTTKNKLNKSTSVASYGGSGSISGRTYTKREEKRPACSDDDEDIDETDILSDEQEFMASPNDIEESSLFNNHSEDVKRLAKQDLLLLLIGVVKNIQEMCNVSFPIAAILLHHYKWDKDKLIERWIEDVDTVCHAAGISLPVVSRKDDTTNLDTLFLQFKEEKKQTPPPRTDQTGTRSTHSVRLFDLLRPYLTNRMIPDSEDGSSFTTLNPIFLLNALNASHNGGSSASSPYPLARRSLLYGNQPLPPASPRISRRAHSQIPPTPSIDDMELAAVQMSLISQVQELFPEVDEPFVVACLREFNNSYERVVDGILEGNLPLFLAERLKVLRGETLPSSDGAEQMLGNHTEGHIEDVENNGASVAPDINNNTTNGSSGGDDNHIYYNREEGEFEYLDGASTNVASDMMFHSVCASHEDYTENPNAWGFSATHTEMDSLSDSMTTNTSTHYYNQTIGSDHYAVVDGAEEQPTGEILQRGSFNLFADYNNTGDNHNLTSEHTSVSNAFDNGDNTSDDEEELVVRRKKTALGRNFNDVYDKSDTDDIEGARIDDDESSVITNRSEGGNNTNDGRENIGVQDRSDVEDRGGQTEDSAYSYPESWVKFVGVRDYEPHHHGEAVHFENSDVEDIGGKIEDGAYSYPESWVKFVSVCEYEPYHGEAVNIKNSDFVDNIEGVYTSIPTTIESAREEAIGVVNEAEEEVYDSVTEEDINSYIKSILDKIVDGVMGNKSSGDNSNEQEAKEVKEVVVEDLITCPVCYTDSPPTDSYCLPCEHSYCLDCWRNYLNNKLTEGFTPALTSSCMNPQCKLVVDVSSWRHLLVDERQYLRYQWFLLKSFVDNCPKAVWCTNPNSCGYAVYYDGIDIPSILDVQCECGWKFCFHCGEEAHQPASCRQLSNWQALRSGEEGQNALWLSQNTKRCPACKVHIEKNEGCMHLSCKNCHHEFCWLCKGSWAEHGDKTGGYYSCNRYDPMKHDTPDLDMRFGKYVHHFQRYTYHANARKVAEIRRPDISSKEPKITFGDEPWDRAFLYDILDLIVSCRNLLKFTYVFGFYLEESKEKELFEFLQEDLEKSTEYLSEVMFREIDNISLPISDPEDILLIKTSTKVTRKFLDNLLAGIHNGLIADYGPPSDNIKSYKGKKVTRKISRILTLKSK